MTPTRMFGVGAFLLGSVVGGAIGLSGLASAASSDTSTTATTIVDDSSSTTSDTTDAGTDTGTGTGTDVDPAGRPAGPHIANGITEEALTGDTASSVEAAVLAAYPDATIDRMETDAEGAAYEAHITLADGSRATVKLDASFTVTATETDIGRGGCGPGHAPGDIGDTTSATTSDTSGDTTADTSTTS